MEGVSFGAGMISGAIKDTTGLQLINKTLSKQQEVAGLASSGNGPSASVNISVNEALGKGTRLDITV